jgi:site-specific DNA-methyltransferase (adenine-specific)
MEVTEMTPVIIGGAKLYLGKSEEILPTIGAVDALVTDPPYGILNLAGDVDVGVVRKSARQQGSGKLKNRILNTSSVEWDIAPSAEFIALLRSMSKRQIIWGGNYFDLPPARGILVWDKEQPWVNFSQVELAWTNLSRPAAIFKESATRGTPNKQHPTQKPLSLMTWCISLLGDVEEVFDPYMGSGTTGVAAVQLGRQFIGIERDERYFEIACRRIEQAVSQGQLFTPAPAKQEQVSLL